MKKTAIECLTLASALAALAPGRADACGGCFVQQSERTVVTDHRMALSISTQQTVLWDQIRYSGNPAEFAWVLPVRPGATIEVSNDAFFTALDASTQPIVYAPSTYGGAYGCGLAGCASQSTSAFGDSSGAPGAGQVQIVSQSVVGPYETVTLRATDPSALRKWLKSHAYDIPDSIGPTIDAYVAESFDFIALRLRPTCGERSMRPVRIVTQGADPTLPLRMVAAGIGARVGLTLYVISEGRWQPQNFPHATIDASRLLWNRTQNKSNYEPLSEELMAAQGGRTWVTEYAAEPQLFSSYDPRYGGRAPGYVATGAPGLADTYFSQCVSRRGGLGSPSTPGQPAQPAQPFTPCPDPGPLVAPKDAGVNAIADGGNASDAGDRDASTDAGDRDGGTSFDSGTTSGEGTSPPRPGGLSSECLYLDDLDVALRGLHPKDVWVTRLRAALPANALSAGDLRLEPSREQTFVTNVHYTTAYTDEVSAGAGSRDACVSAPKRRTAFGSWALATVSALAALAFLRRRARR